MWSLSVGLCAGRLSGLELKPDDASETASSTFPDCQTDQTARYHAAR